MQINKLSVSLTKEEIVVAKKEKWKKKKKENTFYLTYSEKQIKTRHYFVPSTSLCPQIFENLKSLVKIGGEDLGKEHI